MKALVTYYSQTGNTEKVARSIYDSLKADKELLPAQDVRDVTGYDVVFCGFPVQAHSVPVKVHGLLKNLPDGQKIAFFCTHGSLRGGSLPKQAIESAIGIVPRAKVLGTFGILQRRICPGHDIRKLRLCILSVDKSEAGQRQNQ